MNIVHCSVRTVRNQTVMIFTKRRSEPEWTEARNGNFLHRVGMIRFRRLRQAIRKTKSFNRSDCDLTTFDLFLRL